LLYLKYSFCSSSDSAARGGRAPHRLLATLSGSPSVAACSKSTVALSTAVLIFEKVPCSRRSEREHMFFQMFIVIYLNVTPTGKLHIKIACSFITNIRLHKRPFRSMSTKIPGSWGIRVIFTRNHKIASFEIGKLTLVQILQEVDCVARILLCN